MELKERVLENRLTLNGSEKNAKVFLRIDPFTEFPSYISEERARRKMFVLRTQVQYEKNCDFCNPYFNTPEPRKHHEGGAVSVPNYFPWSMGQFVTIYPPFKENGNDAPVLHRLFPSELEQKDLTSMIEALWDLANYSYFLGAEAYLFFTNWGPLAGASRQHPHSQFTMLDYVSPLSLLKIEVDLARRYYLNTGKNIYDEYVRMEEENGARRIFSNENVYIGAPFAPKFSDEILIISKKPVSSILELEVREDRLSVMQPAWGIFPFLYFYRSVMNFNMVFHNAPISEIKNSSIHPSKYYRMHIHIYPRKNGLPVDIAGAELGALCSVPSKLPEETAHYARLWYSSPYPSEEYLPKKQVIIEGKPTEVVDEELLDQFRMCMRAMPQRKFYHVDDNTE